MPKLDLRGCKIVLENLLGVRARHFAHLGAGARHLANLQALYADVVRAIEWEARPKPETVRSLVSRHAQATKALSGLLTAHRYDPLNSDAQRAAAERLATRLVAGCQGAQHSAVRRTEFADRARDRLRSLEADLCALPARVGALVQYWIELGDAIKEAMSAKTLEPGSPAPTPQALVQEVSRALSLLRRTVQVEMALTPALPRTLEASLLGFADTMATKPKRKRPQLSEPLTVEAPAPVRLVVRPRDRLVWTPTPLGHSREFVDGVFADALRLPSAPRLLCSEVRSPTEALDVPTAAPDDADCRHASSRRRLH